MKEIVIRGAKKADFSDIKELVKQLYEEVVVKEGMEKELKMDKFNELLDDPGIIILVAETDKKVVGYLTINFNKALLDIGLSAIIDELAVHKRARGLGVGTELVSAAVASARERGCSEIGVGTEFENKGAREFYKKCGFDEIGVIFEKHLTKY